MGDRLRAGIPSWYVTSQLSQLSLASFRGRLIEYQLRLEYGGCLSSKRSILFCYLAVLDPRVGHMHHGRTSSIYLLSMLGKD